jgi:hypothetical protein
MEVTHLKVQILSNLTQVTLSARSRSGFYVILLKEILTGGRQTAIDDKLLVKSLYCYARAFDTEDNLQQAVTCIHDCYRYDSNNIAIQNL